MKFRNLIVVCTALAICNAFAAVSIDPIARTFTKAGGAGTILTSGSGTWTATTDSDWITIKPRTTGDAGVSCVYVVSKNMSTDTRTGIVLVDDNAQGYIDGIASTAIETKILFLPAAPFLFEEKSDTKEESKKYFLLKAETPGKDGDFSTVLKYCPRGRLEASFMKLSISDALALKYGKQKIRVLCENASNLIFDEWETV